MYTTVVDEASRLSMKTPAFLVELLLQALEKHLSNNKLLGGRPTKESWLGCVVQFCGVRGLILHS
jgi:hypothetical protein